MWDPGNDKEMRLPNAKMLVTAQCWHTGVMCNNGGFCKQVLVISAPLARGNNPPTQLIRVWYRGDGRDFITTGAC